MPDGTPNKRCAYAYQGCSGPTRLINWIKQGKLYLTKPNQYCCGPCLEKRNKEYAGPFHWKMFFVGPETKLEFKEYEL